MSASRSTRRAAATKPAPRASLLLPTVLIAIAAFVAPIFAGIPAPQDQGWTNLVCALSLISIAWVLLADRRTQTQPRPVQLTECGCIGVVAVAVVSMGSRIMVVQHGSAQYIDPMMHATAYWAAMAALTAGGFAVCRRSRVNAYCLLVAMVAAAAFASALAVQDYLRQVIDFHTGMDWREFGTSTPDFFAGYLLITIPIALALFLSAPAAQGRRAGWLFALALVLELAALPITGSRFALISFAILAVVFAVGLVVAAKGGLELSKPLKIRLAALAVIAILGGGLFARPVLHRLEAGTMAAQANSGAFRVYTWRGALRMAARFPLLGAGPGMFVYIYPQFANVGFTRLAHSGYLQLLDDLGPLGDISILLIFAGGLWAGASALRAAGPVESGNACNALLEHVAEPSGDDRIVIIGLASGVVGGLVQNAIDSDWYITLCGVTLFLAAGVLLGLSTRRSPEPAESKRLRSPIRLSSAAAAAMLVLACLTWSLAGFQSESGNYIEAAQTEPLSADYAADLAWKVNFPAGDISACERNLSAAIAMAPTSVWFDHRAELYDETSRPQLALADIKTGLEYDPNSLPLLLLAAQVSDNMGNHQSALGYYARMTELQNTAYGTAPAIGGVVEYRYAFADFAMGADAFRGGQPKTAAGDLQSAQTILQSYADEGGSNFAMRQAETGGHSDPQLDRSLQTLYDQVMPQLIAADRAEGDASAATAARAQQQKYDRKFQSILRKSSR